MLENIPFLNQIPLLYLQLTILGILLALSAIFSSFETAIATLSKIQIHQLVKEGKKGAEFVAKLKKNLNKTIITILIGNNLVNISASALATLVATDLFGSSGVGIAIGILTFLILIFGEITPKAYAAQNAGRLACRLAQFYYYLSIALSPVVWILSKVANAFIRMLGGEVGETPEVTPEAIKAMAELGAEEGVLAETEKQIIHRVVEFNNTTAGAIMTPRVRLIAVSDKWTPADIRKKLSKSPFSRIPVYEGDKDKITGILLIREFYNKYSPRMRLSSVMAKPYFVTQEKKVDDLLREMQKKEVHMAIILDPNGGVAGLVTMEDILEELIGDIYDETDINKHLVTHISKKTFETNAEVKLKNIDEALKITLPREKISSFGSLSEFILNKLGHIPVPGERVELEDVVIEVRKMKNHRIDLVKITKK